MKIYLPDGFSGAEDPVRELLRDSKSIAVVGLSSDVRRPSYEVASYLKGVGYTIIPVNPNETEVLGEKAYARLEDVPGRIDIVDVFRRAEFLPEIAEAAVAVKAKVLWMQLGIVNADAAERARAGGLVVVEDSCLFVEDRRRRRGF
ncbi:MAG: CoA-binding protein [Candidatus Acidiferrum sp.]